jgi:acetyl esterase/lipase
MLRKNGKPLPNQVITMSPWLDMENKSVTIETNNDTDFLITREGLQGNIDRYIEGVVNPTDPMVNALYADLSGFPRLYICAGDIESLFDNSTRFNELAKESGVDVTFSIGNRMQHVYPFLAGNLARADEEIALIAKWYKSGRAK